MNQILFQIQTIIQVTVFKIPIVYFVQALMRWDIPPPPPTPTTPPPPPGSGGSSSGKFFQKKKLWEGHFRAILETTGKKAKKGFLQKLGKKGFCLKKG